MSCNEIGTEQTARIMSLEVSVIFFVDECCLIVADFVFFFRVGSMSVVTIALVYERAVDLDGVGIQTMWQT